MIQYPHVFEEDVLEKIKDWVMDETSSVSVEYQNWKHDLGGKEVSDFEMLKTFSTGLLAVCLTGYALTVDLPLLFLILFLLTSFVHISYLC